MRSCWARCSRSRLPSASSTYRVAAVAGGPRCSDRARTITRYSNGPRRIRSRSPTASSFARFARAPPTSTLPPPIAAAARARVLKKRAAHNHRSSRTRDPSDMAPPLPAGYGPRATPGMRIMGTAAPPKPFFVLLGCGTPGVRGVAGTAPAPNVLWTPPRQPAAAPAAAPPELPADLAGRIAELKLTDVIDIALRNNTATSAAWADARSAAASYGAAKGQIYPTVALNGTVTAIRRTVSSAGQQAVEQQFSSPTLNLSWLLLDFGGRSGSIGAARAALLAADWTHNASLQSVVLAVEQAYFLYLGTKALLDAQQTTLKEAQTNLEAAEQRHRVGLARSQALPSISVGGNAGETYFISNPPPGSAKSGNSYNATLTISIPLFSGGSQIYNVKAASAAADAAARRAQGFEQQVVYQVFNAYYGLRTSTQQVRTSRDLLASATESEQVALARYKAGAGSLLDLLTAQAALASARALAIQARLSWNTALAQLAHDVGILGLDGSSPLQMQTDTTGTPK